MTLLAEYWRYITDTSGLKDADVPVSKRILFDIARDYQDRTGRNRRQENPDEGLLFLWLKLIEKNLDSTPL